MCYDDLLDAWKNIRSSCSFPLALDSYIYYTVFPCIPRPVRCPSKLNLLKKCLRLLDDYYFNKDFKYYRFDEVLDCDIKFFLKLKKEYL